MISVYYNQKYFRIVRAPQTIESCMNYANRFRDNCPYFQANRDRSANREIGRRLLLLLMGDLF